MIHILSHKFQIIKNFSYLIFDLSQFCLFVKCTSCDRCKTFFDMKVFGKEIFKY